MNKIFEIKKDLCKKCGKETNAVYFNNKRKNELCENCTEDVNKKSIKDITRNIKKERIDIEQALKKINVQYSGDILLPSQNNTVIKLQNELKANLKKHKKGFYLYGISGSGKTTNMQIFAHHLLYTPKSDQEFRSYKEFLFLTESNFISKIFSLAKDEFSWNFQLALNSYLKGKRFIFLDEFAALPLNEKEIQILDLAFHYFEEKRNELRVFLTSNKSLEQLKEFYLNDESDSGSRIISRLYHLVLPKKMEEVDYRQVDSI